MNRTGKKSIFSALPLDQITIDDAFWSPKLEVNAKKAIYHQWEKLEESGTIDNFRIIAGQKQGVRRGIFYWDSDSHKWSEAAATILHTYNEPKLQEILNNYIDLLAEAQDKDGYLFTYNQAYFKGKKWINLQIEHELYSFGHLIEAAVEYYKVTKSEKYLDIAKRIADLLVQEFKNLKSKHTPGHQEIEIALIKLYRTTGDKQYLDLAESFILKRGRNPFFVFQIAQEFISQGKRASEVLEQQKLMSPDSIEETKILSDLSKDGPKNISLRFYLSNILGKYAQQHKPITKMKKPVGHSVRFGYYATAAAMLYQETGNQQILRSLERLWDHMVQKRMYITGGIGSLPLLEGFGRDYELNNRYAYCETCAAISSVFWSWEMLLNTHHPKYADLLEWQLYNSVSVGMAIDGRSYFYRNPLEVRGFLVRKEWYRTACCPSNISRTWARIGNYIYTYNNEEIWIHQYMGNEAIIEQNTKKKTEMKCKLETELPWSGTSIFTFTRENKADLTLHFRIPSWTENPTIIVNDKKSVYPQSKAKRIDTASGYNPYASSYISIQEEWKDKNKIELTFPIKVKTHHSHNKVKTNKKKAALSKGPLVYCFESIDNTGANIPYETINLDENIRVETSDILNRIQVLKTKNKEGDGLVAIPYYSWGNRGESSMQVWIDVYSKSKTI